MNNPVKKAFLVLLPLIGALSLAGCGGASPGPQPTAAAQPILPNQPAHPAQRRTEYGRLVEARQVEVQGLTTGGGMAVGMATGAGIGNAVMMGGARGGGALIGMVAGAVVGNEAEHDIEKGKAMRYTVAKENGGTATIVQGLAKGEAPLKTGRRVMISVSGGSIRVLPAEKHEKHETGE